MPDIRIDLYSDTHSKPTPEMRRFMCTAEVGDEQKGEDPTVNELQQMVCELLGKEAAVFLPSGTMCNQIAFAVHCKPGDLIAVERFSHPIVGEGGGSAVIASASVYPIDGSYGMFTAEQVCQCLWPPSRYTPSVSLVSIEQTTNFGGGRVWPLEQIQEICRTAREHGVRTHLDGARLMNAVVASGVPARDYAAPFDSAWIDLSKGLGAPVGAVLAGSHDFIRQAWQWKQRIGGALRQAGIVAAAGIYALRRHVDRLQEDHENAKIFARAVASCPSLQVDVDAVITNIVRIDVEKTGLSARAFADRLLVESGIRLSVIGPTLCRAVTYLDISRQDAEEAAAATAALAKRVS